jgi:hypothetical protein
MARNIDTDLRRMCCRFHLMGVEFLEQLCDPIRDGYSAIVAACEVRLQTHGIGSGDWACAGFWIPSFASSDAQTTSSSIESLCIRHLAANA